MKTRFITNLLLYVLGFAIYSAYADTVVVVSPSNSISKLDKQQVSELFLGKKSVFPDGREVVPVEQQGNVLSLAFHSKVLNMRESQYKAYWSRLVFTGIAKPPQSNVRIGSKKYDRKQSERNWLH